MACWVLSHAASPSSARPHGFAQRMQCPKNTVAPRTLSPKPLQPDEPLQRSTTFGLSRRLFKEFTFLGTHSWCTAKLL